MISSSPEETQFFGEKIAATLIRGDVITLYGDLGSGKTTLMKGLVSAHADISAHEIHSPTFTYLEIYEGEIPLYHFDLYRLDDMEAFIEKGFLDFLEGEGICAIEWPQKIEPLLASLFSKKIYIDHIEGSKRRIDVQ